MKQLTRYILVQTLAYCVDMGGFIVLLSCIGLNPLMATMISKGGAGIVAFIAHRAFTFRLSRAALDPRQALRYFTLLILNIPLTAIVLAALLWLIPMVVIAKFIADVACLLFTYWVSARFIFIDRRRLNEVDNNQGQQ